MKKRVIPSDFVFVVLLLAVGVFLFGKCRIGFGSSDEAFYLTVPYRLNQGDALLAEEWHGSQMAGVLLLPALAGYLNIFKSTEGILLAFRYVYTAVTILFACFYYYRLRKCNGMAAAVAALCFCIYAPFGIMALSYNSMGILCLLTACVILATMERRRCLQAVVAGVFFAAAVLCCPYLAALYPAYGLLVSASAFLRRIWAKRTQGAPSFLLTGKAWCCLTAGICLAVAVFLIFILSRTTLKRVLEALPNILDDPEHPAETFKQKFAVYEWGIMHSNGAAPYTAAGIGALALAVCFDRKRYEHQSVYFIVACLLSGFYLYPFLTEQKYINYLMFPVNILGLFSALVSVNPKVKRMLCAGWLPGMAYTLCIHMSSNQVFYAISSASTVATVFSVVMAAMVAAEALAGKKKAIGTCAAGCVAVLFAVQLGAQAWLRNASVFWDGKRGEQTCLLTEGPEAGLYASEENRARYTALLSDAACVRTDPDVKKVLYASLETWLYLADDAETASYSAWLSGVSDKTMERLERYSVLDFFAPAVYY